MGSDLARALEFASEKLSSIPSEKSLVDWEDNDTNRKILRELFISCTDGKNNNLPSFGSARATKMLHKKRPLLIPIIDSWQLRAWGFNPDNLKTDEMVEMVTAAQLELHHARSAADSGLVGRLTDIRIYDILFWEMSNRLPNPLA